MHSVASSEVGQSLREILTTCKKTQKKGKKRGRAQENHVISILHVPLTPWLCNVPCSFHSARVITKAWIHALVKALFKLGYCSFFCRANTVFYCWYFWLILKQVTLKVALFYVRVRKWDLKKTEAPVRMIVNLLTKTSLS